MQYFFVSFYDEMTKTERLKQEKIETHKT